MSRSRYGSQKGLQRIRVLLVIGILLLVMTPFFVLSFIKKDDLPDKKPLAFTSHPSPILFRRHSEASYKVSYPDGWKTDLFALDNGVQNVVLKPSYLPSDSSVPGIVVSVGDIFQTPVIASKEKFFVDHYNFQRDRVLVGDLPAIRLRGTFMADNDTPLQETHVTFTRGRYSYFIIYRYKDSEPDYASEKIFADFLEGFQFGN